MTEQRGAFPAAYVLDDNKNAPSTRVFDPEKRLKTEDFPLLGQIVAVYKPFRRITTDLQSAGVTSSLVVPAVMELIGGLDQTSEIVVEMPAAGTNYPATSVTKRVDELDPAVQQIARQARADLIKRFVLGRMLPLAIASCLDPRVKVRYCMTLGVWTDMENV